MRLEFESAGATLAFVDALDPEFWDARRESNLLGARRLVRDAAASPDRYQALRHWVAGAKSSHGVSLQSRPQVLDRLTWMIVLGELRVEPVAVEAMSLPPPGPPPVAAPAPQARKKEETQLDWIGVELVDEDGNALVGEEYEIVLSDGRTEKGEFTETGSVNVQAIPRGTCKVKFPKLDRARSKT